MTNDAWIKKIGVVFLLIAVVFGISFFYINQEQVTPAPSENDIALSTTINDCDEITERAAAHLKAVVEFQKLEIIGRKARVFKLCMRDHGYRENKRWLDYTMPIAKKKANVANISVDEALENLRRAEMKVADIKPSYWIKRETK
ncbi:MAG TPA: hypothetical protein VLM20_04510 [Methylophilaceae bacterium]|nr:hypothetical protein [Methylophilaceae bacterium]